MSVARCKAEVSYNEMTYWLAYYKIRKEENEAERERIRMEYLNH